MQRGGIRVESAVDYKATVNEALQDCLNQIQDLKQENSALRQQRDEYARQTIVLQDRVGQLENCSKCEEALRDAYAVRLELARLQTRYISVNLALDEAIDNHSAISGGGGEEVGERDEVTGSTPSKHGDDKGKKKESKPSDQDIDVMDGLFTDLILAKRRMENYREAFLSVQADNKDLRQKIDTARREETAQYSANEFSLRQEVQSLEAILIEVKAERNNYRSKTNSLTRELMHGDEANNKRLCLIADLRLQITSQKGELKSLKAQLNESKAKPQIGICTRSGVVISNIAKQITRKGGRTNKVGPHSPEPFSPPFPLQQQRSLRPSRGTPTTGNEFTTSSDRSPTQEEETKKLAGHFRFFLCH